ncbi:MAG: beta-lactamase family protein [Candidatus Eremiobacteraeota bacterium]|nr:beta-lactamase family protein [Candidatus Eremiobacteraeota bacterium]
MTYLRRAALACRVVVFVLLGAVCADAQSTVPQSTIPQTPAGTQFAGWLAAFNGGDPAAYKAFVEKNWPAGVKFLAEDKRFRETTGGFDLRKVDPSSTPAKFVALVQERNSDQLAQVILTVEAAEPHHIAELLLRAVPRPAEFALPHLSMDDLVAALRAKLQRDSAADRFAGAVLVAQDGKPVFAQAYGLADIAHKIPNTLQTRFRIGSMNKMFTAVAVLQLGQAGKLRLDASLGTYLPDYPNKDVAAKVTIHELLTHTGGTGDIFGPQFEAHRLELRTLDDYVRTYGQRGLSFEPGSRWAYSNYGFILLGAVIHKVSGQSYYDYVREHVYAPAGMTSTGSEPESTAVPNRSIGYMTDEAGNLKPNTDTLPYRGTSAGGGYSTVEDLLRFANALHDHKLLDANYTELLTTGKVDMPGGRRYAYGFGDEMVNGTRCVGHNGGAPGMSGDLAICAGGRYVVAVLANRDPDAADKISGFVTNRLPLK